MKKRDAAEQKAKEQAFIKESCDQQYADVIYKTIATPAFKIFKRLTEGEQKIMAGFMPSDSIAGYYPDSFAHYKTLTRAERQHGYDLAEAFVARERSEDGMSVADF